jgi:hypothetical protein
VIASKPSFILDELKATKLPVVFLDTDLEFYSFPHLFVKGGWPNGGRDVAIFNYWGSETDSNPTPTPTPTPTRNRPATTSLNPTPYP